MFFSDTINKNGLVQEIDFICGTDSTSYPIEDKTRNINIHYYRVGILHWRFSPIWNFDDSNYTTHSIASTNLVNDQSDYELPTTLIAIERVAILNKEGDECDLIERNYDEIADVAEYQEPAGLPRYYAKRGNSIWLFPKVNTSDVTATNGLKLYLTRLVDPFVKTDTSKEPGFNAGFHRVLSLGASTDYLMINKPNLYDRVKVEYNALLDDLINFLKQRQKDDRRLILEPRSENYE